MQIQDISVTLWNINDTGPFCKVTMAEGELILEKHEAIIAVQLQHRRQHKHRLLEGTTKLMEK